MEGVMIKFQLFFKRQGFGLFILTIFLLGIGLRFLDLTDQPLDYNPSRQLRSASIARALYYRMLPDATPQMLAFAQNTLTNSETLEPLFFESIVALTYRLIGEEILWLARIYAILFWALGGIPLYLLANRITSRAGGIISLLFYFFIPYTVLASRAFMPEPLLIMVWLLSLYFMFQWKATGKLSWAIVAGIIGGLTILVKSSIIFLVAIPFAFIALSSQKLLAALKNKQVWLIAAITIIIPAIYYGIMIGSRTGDLISHRTLPYWHLWFETDFYFLWLAILLEIVQRFLLWISLAGVAFPSRGRMILGSLWISYLVYGFFFAYYIHTHNYYSVPAIPIISLSMAPIASTVAEKMKHERWIWKAFIVLVFGSAFLFEAWLGRNQLFVSDYRSEPVIWKGIVAALPEDGAVLALTQEHGARMWYYGQISVRLWPNTGTQYFRTTGGGGPFDFEQYYHDQTGGISYFLITDFADFNKQTLLKNRLEENYPVYSQGDGFLIFDMRSPINP
jgi:hypothetical protein